MDLTSRQQNELHIAVYEYLRDREVFRPAAQILIESSNAVLRFLMAEQAQRIETTSLLEKKWHTVLGLQKEINDLENLTKRRVSCFESSVADERHKLDAAVYSYLKNRPEHGFQKVSTYMLTADSSLAGEDLGNITDLQSCWIQVPILQKKLNHLNIMNGQERCVCVPDEITKDSVAYSQSELLAISEPMEEPKIDDEHQSLTKEGGILLDEDQYSMDNEAHLVPFRSDMDSELPIIHDMARSTAQLPGQEELQATLKQRDPSYSQPNDSFNEDQFNMVVSWATAVVHEADAEENRVQCDLTAGKSFFHRMYFLGSGTQDRGDVPGPSPNLAKKKSEARW